MKNFVRSFLLGSLLAMLSASPAAADLLRGVGAMGDSLTDPYEHYSYNYARNWIEQLIDHRGWYAGQKALAQYEYVLAESGATSFSLLQSEQHIRMAERVASGDVTLAFLAIGSNDFAYSSLLYRFIYDNDITGAARELLIQDIVGWITTALDTVLDAGPQGMVLGTVPDYGFAPRTQGEFPDPERRARVSSVIDDLNELLIAEGMQRNVPVADLKGLADYLTSVGPQLTLGGVSIDLFSSSSGPYTGFVGDGIHINTTLQGLLANLFIEAVNTAYGNQLDEPLLPFSDLEILQHAGIGDEYTGETFSTMVDMSDFVFFTPVPEPSTWLLAAAGAGLLVVARRRHRVNHRAYSYQRGQ